MLNKSLCNKCYKKGMYSDPMAGNPARWKSNPLADYICRVPMLWPIDQKYFKGQITGTFLYRNCIADAQANFNPDYFQPPDFCPYLLEHTVNTEA